MDSTGALSHNTTTIMQWIQLEHCHTIQRLHNGAQPHNTTITQWSNATLHNDHTMEHCYTRIIQWSTQRSYNGAQLHNTTIIQWSTATQHNDHTTEHSYTTQGSYNGAQLHNTRIMQWSTATQHNDHTMEHSYTTQRPHNGFNCSSACGKQEVVVREGGGTVWEKYEERVMNRRAE